jgi:tetratricopeptide (TPR) repeat protein
MTRSCYRVRARFPVRANALAQTATMTAALAAVACIGRTAPSVQPAAERRAPPPPPSSAVHFIEDDYKGALAEAQARDIPLFIDAWAPWCHTCLSMREFVFTDVRLRAVANSYVWLSLDTEKEQNAAIVSKLEVSVLPTLFIVSSGDERVSVAWRGSLTTPELLALIDETRSRTRARGDLAVDTLVAQSNRNKRYSECATVATQEAPRMPPGTALVDVLRYGLDCIDGHLKSAGARGELEQLADLGERVASDPSQPILADDRSDLYSYVIHALETLGRKGDATTLAATWASFLEDQAARSPTPSARAVFDAHRLLAYIALDEPDRAIPMLEQSARDFPNDYNPPARLATAYLALKRYKEALAASDRAIAFAYGPRKMHLLSQQADIRVASGDRAGARASLRAAINVGSKLELTGSYPKELQDIRKRLSKTK